MSLQYLQVNNKQSYPKLSALSTTAAITSSFSLAMDANAPVNVSVARMHAQLAADAAERQKQLQEFLATGQHEKYHSLAQQVPLEEDPYYGVEDEEGKLSSS